MKYQYDKYILSGSESKQKMQMTATYFAQEKC